MSSNFMGTLMWLCTNSKFLPLLGISGQLVLLPSAMSYLYCLWQWFREDSSSQRNIHGTSTFKNELFYLFFSKYVGTEAFFLCAAVACLKSMFDYGSSGVVRVNFCLNLC